jgi:hypothetical protein
MEIGTITLEVKKAELEISALSAVCNKSDKNCNPFSFQIFYFRILDTYEVDTCMHNNVQPI